MVKEKQTLEEKQAQVARNRKQYQDRLKRKPGEHVGQNQHGLFCGALRTHREVAEIMGLTPERIRQIEREALFKLRRALKDHNPFTQGTAKDDDGWQTYNRNPWED